MKAEPQHKQGCLFDLNVKYYCGNLFIIFRRMMSGVLNISISISKTLPDCVLWVTNMTHTNAHKENRVNRLSVATVNSIDLISIFCNTHTNVLTATEGPLQTRDLELNVRVKAELESNSGSNSKPLEWRACSINAATPGRLTTTAVRLMGILIKYLCTPTNKSIQDVGLYRSIPMK